MGLHDQGATASLTPRKLGSDSVAETEKTEKTLLREKRWAR